MMKKLADYVEKIGQTVTEGYRKIEDGVVAGSQKIENGFVSGFEKVSDKCVQVLFAHEGESLDAAKERLRRTEE